MATTGKGKNNDDGRRQEETLPYFVIAVPADGKRHEKRYLICEMVSEVSLGAGLVTPTGLDNYIKANPLQAAALPVYPMFIAGAGKPPRDN